MGEKQECLKKKRATLSGQNGELVGVLRRGARDGGLVDHHASVRKADAPAGAGTCEQGRDGIGLWRRFFVTRCARKSEYRTESTDQNRGDFELRRSDKTLPTTAVLTGQLMPLMTS